MNAGPFKLTAGEIGEALGIRRQSVYWYLKDVPELDVKVIGGKLVSAWSFDQLPQPLLDKLNDVARSQGYRDARMMFTRRAGQHPQWQPAVPLVEMADSEIEKAKKLRAALAPWFHRRHVQTVSSGELEALSSQEYKRIFGNTVSARYIRKLIERTVERDAGRNEFERIELYTSERPARKTIELVPLECDEEIPGVAAIVAAPANAAQLTRSGREAIWHLAYTYYGELLNDGITSKRAARKIRDCLWLQVPQLAPSRDAILKAFSRKVVEGKLEDGRRDNGDRFSPPQEDIDLLRYSSFAKNGGRMDSAWQEEYERLSDYTRERYPWSFEMPVPMRRLVNREFTDALSDAHHGKRKLKKRIGGIERDWSAIPSMHLWTADDLTATIECILGDSLLLPQIVAVMDSASRKFVGWAISPEKAPTAELVVEATVDAIKRHGVPRKIGLENGFVFGKSLNINGKVDSAGRTMVFGLAKYGCSIRHFNKMNPQSKGELEKAFDLVQRLMERHPGYTGRIQMLHAGDDFKREQRLIRSGKIDGRTKRYTYEELRKVIDNIFHQYNAAPREVLKGFSPNEEFERRQDKTNPPIKFGPELHWFLANERYRVPVKAGGVWFTHFGKTIRVRGGKLSELVGSELLALVDRRDPELVTFMTTDFKNPFTMEVCKKVSADESSTDPDAGILAGEQKKAAEHIQAINAQRVCLIEKHGDPREELLAQARFNPQRITAVPAAMVESASQMEQQREEIRTRKQNEEKSRQRIRQVASKAGVHPDAVADPESLKRITELLNDD